MAAFCGRFAELMRQTGEAHVAGGVQEIGTLGTAPDAEKVVPVLAEKVATRASRGWAH